MKPSKDSDNSPNFSGDAYYQPASQLQRRNSQHSSGYSSLENCVVSAETPSLMYYMMGNVIGKGNFSSVRKAEHLPTTVQVAIKIVEKTKLTAHDLGRVSREVSILKRLRHPRITRMYQVMETTTKLFIVMEYVPNGELFDYVQKHGRFSEPEARDKFTQLVDAVEYCHAQGVVHRDLKMENILLDGNMDVKLADFGFGNYFQSDTLLQTFCGSPPYASPEIFQGVPYHGVKSDIWSLGVILYCMVVGGMPFEQECLPALRRQVLSGKFRVPYWVSLECDNLIRSMLRIQPERRSTIGQIREHPWMRRDKTIGGRRPSSASLSNLHQSHNLNTTPFPWNHEALHAMERYGHSKQLIHELLHRGTYDHVMAHYLLLCDYLDSTDAPCPESQTWGLLSPRSGHALLQAPMSSPRFLYPSPVATDSGSPSPDVMLESHFSQLRVVDNTLASPVHPHKMPSRHLPQQPPPSSPVWHHRSAFLEAGEGSKRRPGGPMFSAGGPVEIMCQQQPGPWQLLPQPSRLSSAASAATPYLQRRMSLAVPQETTPQLGHSPRPPMSQQQQQQYLHPKYSTPASSHAPHPWVSGLQSSRRASDVATQAQKYTTTAGGQTTGPLQRVEGVWELANMAASGVYRPQMGGMYHAAIPESEPIVHPSSSHSPDNNRQQSDF